MKKVAVAVLMLVIALAMGACKRSQVTNMGQALDGWANPPQSQPPYEVSIKEYQGANFAQDLGIEVASLPDTDQYIPNKFFVLDDWYGQIEFTTTDNLSLNVRLARAEGGRLSSTYEESHIYDKETLDIDGIEVKIATSQEGCALVSWVRGDIQYVLHSNRKQGVPPRQAIEDMVTQLDSTAVDGSQGG